MTAVARMRGLLGAGRRRLRTGWVLAAVLLVGLLVASLAVLDRSGSGSGGAATVDTDSTHAAAPSAAPSAERAASSAASDSASRGGAVSAPVPGGPASGAALGVVDRQLVRTAQLSLNVTDTAAAVQQIRTSATAARGLVVEEETAQRRSSLTLRVPSDALDRVIDEVAATGTVRSRTSQVVDSTADVVDLDARVATQQASVARVRALLAKATSIGDVVNIESELARREGDLDSLTNRLAALRDQVAMSTLSVSLYIPATAGSEDDDRAVGFTDGLAAGWQGLGQLGTATGAVLGFVLPFVPVLAVLGGLVWAVRRFLRGRRVVAAAGSAGAAGSGGAEG